VAITSQLQGHSAQVSAAYYGTSDDQLRNIPASKVEQSRFLSRLFHREFKLDVIGYDIYQYNFNKKSILRPPEKANGARHGMPSYSNVRMVDFDNPYQEVFAGKQCVSAEATIALAKYNLRAKTNYKFKSLDQAMVISEARNRDNPQNFLAVLPTGADKSLYSFLPAILRSDKSVVVILPYLSLIDDMDKKLKL
jgi:superfamily II DNA helicase RecQ